MLVFFWTGMVTYIFYCIIIVYILCSYVEKKSKKIYRKEKKRYRWKSVQNRYSVHREHTILPSRERVNKGTKRMNSLRLSPHLISSILSPGQTVMIVDDSSNYHSLSSARSNGKKLLWTIMSNLNTSKLHDSWWNLMIVNHNSVFKRAW